MSGRQMSAASSYHGLFSVFAHQTTTHGIRKIVTSRHPIHKMFWVIVFMTSLGGCCYHCSYLISTYCENPKVTITEERDADIVEFPALTICNLNVIKKEYANSYFELASTRRRRKGNSSNPVPLNVNSTVCFYSEEELLRDSAIDLSDAWLNLGVTKDNLSKYGHKAQDLIVQCTYNSKECGNGSTFGISVTNVTSPTFGLCHTVNVRNKTKDRPASVRKGGTIYGIRLTLNIERDEYWDLISAEYGVRLMVHPQGTYPTLQRGGIIVDPGRSVHIGVRRRVSKLLPGREGSCTDTFADSRVIRLLRKQDLDFELSHLKYTYEHCNTLCQNSLLFEHCGCLDEQPKVGPTIVKWRFCNPCNKTEAICRTNVLKSFTEDNACDDVCKPSCSSIRYDFTLSKADWPNMQHQDYLINRSRADWKKFPEILAALDDSNENTTKFDDDEFFKENLLRVHLYMEEMVYMSIEERYSYTLPKLMADLGGCLGLYLGVSVLSIIELIELIGTATVLGLCKQKNHTKSWSSHPAVRTGSRRKRGKNRNKTKTENLPPGYSFFRPPVGYVKPKGKKTNFSNDHNTWRSSTFFEKNVQEDEIGGKQVIKRF